MGIDQRFAAHFAERFKDLRVLETCTGAGFSTISLARTAKHVFTVEIDQSHQEQAISNVEKAGLSNRVTFLNGNIFQGESRKSDRPGLCVGCRVTGIPTTTLSITRNSKC